MPIIAFVTDTASVTRMLQHLGGAERAAARSPPRGPPESAVPSDESPAFDPEAIEPAPAFQFDQTASW